MRALITALLAFVCFQATAYAEEDATTPIASMNERVLSVPGDAQRPATLQVTVLMPDGQGPFPLAVMNHGASATSRPDLEPRYRFTFAAYYFLSRGYAVALPMMRGFAGSEGKQVLDGCNQEAVGISNAKDIRAVIEFMSVQPYIDWSRLVVAGQSFGGWNALALGTLKLPNVRGLINFSGGADISNCRDTPAALARAAERYGAQTIVPSLWIYGDNDTVFAPPVWRAMFDHYIAAGGRAELVAYGRFMANSHNLLGFPEGLLIWAAKVDAFLTRLGLPAKITHPEYLPAEFPPPSHFATVDDVDAVPYVTEQGRQIYRKFLSDPMPRVFVLSSRGFSASLHGGFDPLGRAMNVCEERSQKCQVYAVDDYVTWVRPTPAPPPSGFAPLRDVSAIPYVTDSGRQGYGKYLMLRKPKAFVVAPDGAWSASSLGDDPLLAALESCKKAHQGCQLYAVDDDIVWHAK
jgi:dienelactone hydrolase